MLQADEKAQARRRQAETAIQLAMANRWEEAVSVNRAILDVVPNDKDAYNRLGKALMELGRHNEAKKAYKKSLELDPTSQIATKNLQRLAVLAKSKAGQVESAQVDPKLFIEEMGKSAITALRGTSSESLAKLNAGDRLELRPRGSALTVETLGGDVVGAVEPKLTHRLLKLIEGGNQYAAAVTSLSGDECRVIIKETYQDPSLVGRPSFPTATAVAGEGPRPYTKGSLIRYGSSRSEDDGSAPESDAGADDGEDGEADWDSDTVIQEGHVRLNEAAAAEDVDDDELEE